MKKIKYLLLVLNCLMLFNGCSSETSNSDVINKIEETITQLKLNDTARCHNFALKFMDSNYNSSMSFIISPSGFDMEKLREKNYNMTIEVSYNVHYQKSYDVWLDIGYLGSPKYEFTLSITEGIVLYENDIKTTSSSINKSHEITFSVAELMNTNLVATFSTDNIQNIILFDNIYKYK